MKRPRGRGQRRKKEGKRRRKEEEEGKKKEERRKEGEKEREGGRRGEEEKEEKKKNKKNMNLGHDDGAQQGVGTQTTVPKGNRSGALHYSLMGRGLLCHELRGKVERRDHLIVE
ncbi:hypothetical protein ACLOJK_003282 [Asimina triloba]